MARRASDAALLRCKRRLGGGIRSRRMAPSAESSVLQRVGALEVVVLPGALVQRTKPFRRDFLVALAAAGVCGGANALDPFG